MSGNAWHGVVDDTRTDFDILAELRAHVARKYIKQCRAASAWGLSPAFVSAVLTGRKEPTKQILDDAGIERVTTYKYKATP